MTAPVPDSGWTNTYTGPRVCSWIKGRFVLSRYRCVAYRWSMKLVSSTIPGLMLSLTSDGRTSSEAVMFDSLQQALDTLEARDLYENSALEMLQVLSELEHRWHDAERAVIDAQQPGADSSVVPGLDKMAHDLYREHDQAKRDIRPHLQELAISHEEILATVSGRG